jgi:hypothetical protein
LVEHGERRAAPIWGLTPRATHLHKTLFGLDKMRVVPVPDSVMAHVLVNLRGASELAKFRMWLVGSRLRAGRLQSDIDLVLSPRYDSLPSDQEIEQALWYCREFGLYGLTPPCVIDPCFRTCGPAVDVAPLLPNTIMKTIKLLSPRLMNLIMAEGLRDYRRVGDLAIEFVRLAQDTDYYKKLPKRVFAGSLSPYLRPAFEIPPADGTTAAGFRKVPTLQCDTGEANDDRSRYRSSNHYRIVPVSL